MAAEQVFAVAGMSCDHCAGAVTRALTAVDGVVTVDVDVAAGAVTVSMSAPVPVERIREAIERAGYELVEA
ncbi:heavy-metal-associated domain-containing protein [Nocardia stercoris]|uniref:Heavy-metal-associated domain-containing protein n=1 Tax=Nocardia stercoris TaxID=2483361 RepID=A0A3M2KS49_9NOCA|nr:cation transporter [Nocardia stercoris]RMI28487.1 heavy-metal-associated domain-containing protein [Nocardia stercoris]